MSLVFFWLSVRCGWLDDESTIHQHSLYCYCQQFTGIYMHRICVCKATKLAPSPAGVGLTCVSLVPRRLARGGAKVWARDYPGLGTRLATSRRFRMCVAMRLVWVRLIVTTSAICSYLTFIPSACTIAGRSSHPDVQLCAHSDILGTILFNAHPLQVFKPKFCPHLTGSQGGAFGYRLGSERGLPINRVAGSNATRVHIWFLTF